MNNRTMILILAVGMCLISTAYGMSEVKLVASDWAGSDEFGISVSVSGNYAVTGAPGHEGSGAAYVYHFNGVEWQEQQILYPHDAGNGVFGTSVGISGEYLIVGQHHDDEMGSNAGAAYIFRYDGTSWQEQQKLLAGDGGGSTTPPFGGDFLGISVAIAGDTAMVGAPGNDEYGYRAGAVYVYHREGSTWIQQQKIVPADAGPDLNFGNSSISISGNTAIVGALCPDNAGAVYVFQYNGSKWAEQQKLTASGHCEWFGKSASVSGDRMIVGAYYGITVMTGSAYIFERVGGSWVEQAMFQASDGSVQNQFASSVGISGDYAIVGEPTSSAVYLYHHDGSAWTEQDVIVNTHSRYSDAFGASAAISDSWFISGAPGDDIEYHAGTGSAFVYGDFGGLGSKLEVPAEYYRAGDLFYCKANLQNPTGDTLYSIRLIVLLDVYGTYLFAPSLTSDLDFYTLDLPAGETVLPVLDSFIWPADVGTADGLIWYSAMLNSSMTEVLGTIDLRTFGWGN